MVATRRLPEPELAANADQRVFLHGVSWAQYEALLETRGIRPVPRIAYLDGEVELMTNSRFHEILKSRIGRLVEVYLLHHDITFEAIGSWTIKDAPREAGAEPDECYWLHDVVGRERPDLAIEVIWTSGSLDKLEIYRRLGVREVWIWKNEVIEIHVLDEDTYQRVDGSVVLPGIALEPIHDALLAASASDAIKQYRELLESNQVP